MMMIIYCGVLYSLLGHTHILPYVIEDCCTVGLCYIEWVKVKVAWYLYGEL